MKVPKKMRDTLRSDLDDVMKRTKYLRSLLDTVDEEAKKAQVVIESKDDHFSIDDAVSDLMFQIEELKNGINDIEDEIPSYQDFLDNYA